MKVNEIKETKEVVVRTTYVAEDGTEFYNKEECEKYEESALFVIKSKLKKLNPEYISIQHLLDEGCDEDEIEIFDVPTEEDLDNLKRYIHITLEQHRGSINNAVNIDKLTCGHEIIVCWWYDKDGCYFYGDGSLEGVLDNIRENFKNCLLTREELIAKREAEKKAKEQA